MNKIFGEQYGSLSEELHQALQNWLGNNTNAATANQRHTAIAANIRSIARRGEDTGLEDGKPKKGSSRAVYFPREPHKLNLDGKTVEAPSALKIAYEGHLDKFREHGDRLLGEHQNEQENDYHVRHFSVVRPVGGDQHSHHFETNHDGVFAPVFDHHEEHHWSLHGRVNKIGAGDFRELTKAPGFPKGISHQEFYDAVNQHHAEAHGIRHYGRENADTIAHVQTHPFVENVTDAMFSTGMHPGDLTKGNMGVWEHPVTGKKHLVITDFGYANHIPALYQKLRRKQSFGR